MQELIFWGKVLLKKYPENELSFSEVIDKAEMLLDKEKEQIINAHGCKQKKSSNTSNYTYTLTGEQYYNETYGTIK